MIINAKFLFIYKQFFYCWLIDVTDDVLEKELRDRADTDYGKKLLDCIAVVKYYNLIHHFQNQIHPVDYKNRLWTDEQWILWRAVFAVYVSIRVWVHCRVLPCVALMPDVIPNVIIKSWK